MFAFKLSPCWFASFHKYLATEILNPLHVKLVAFFLGFVFFQLFFGKHLRIEVEEELTRLGHDEMDVYKNEFTMEKLNTR